MESIALKDLMSAMAFAFAYVARGKLTTHGRSRGLLKGEAARPGPVAERGGARIQTESVRHRVWAFHSRWRLRGLASEKSNYS